MNTRFFGGCAIVNFAFGGALLMIVRALFVEIATFQMDLVWPLYVVAVAHVSVFVWLTVKRWDVDDFPYQSQAIFVFISTISILMIIPIWLVMVPPLVNITYFAAWVARATLASDLLMMAILLDMGLIVGSVAVIRFAVRTWPRGWGWTRLMKKLET